MKSTSLSVVIGTVVLAFGGTVQGAIVNGGFELPPLLNPGDNTQVYLNTVPSWETDSIPAVADGNYVVNGTAQFTSGLEGNNYALLLNFGGCCSSIAPIYGKTTDVLTPASLGTTYTVNAKVGDRADIGAFFGFAGYKISLVTLNNSNPLLADAYNTAQTITTLASVQGNVSPGDGILASVPPLTYTFTNADIAALGRTLFIELSTLGPGPGVGVTGFDAVSITSVPVPEPSSIVLIGTAITGLPFLTRRRTR